MNRYLKVLGDGQIWDLEGIAPDAPQKTFEDLFSGRALGRMAQEEIKIFAAFKEKGRITGFSVTKALLSSNKEAKDAARVLLARLAKNAALGIEALNKGKGFKKNWSGQKKAYWKNLDYIIIGGGVSEGLTGKILVGSIKKYLSRARLFDIKVFQAKFPGKEAGFLGAAINIIKEIRNEAETKAVKVIAAIGLDLGRDEIGVGLSALNADSGKFLKQGNNYWLFKYSVKTPYKTYLKKFLDSRRDYTSSERKFGKHIRSTILKRMSDLVARAENKSQKIGLVCARNVGVAVPGATSPDGYIVNSTDYLPFFRKQDGFNFAGKLEESLIKTGHRGWRIHLINDGIAAGVANGYLGLPGKEEGKFAFLGAGSGLGGCVGEVNTR